MPPTGNIGGEMKKGRSPAVGPYSHGRAGFGIIQSDCICKKYPDAYTDERYHHYYDGTGLLRADEYFMIDTTITL